MKNKLTLFKSVVILALLILPFTFSYAQEEKIQSFETEVVVYEDGTLGVTEGIDYDFGTDQRHGIYRTIPFIKTNLENERFKMKINNFRITDKLGNSYNYEKTTSFEDHTLKIGDADIYVTGVVDYVISYKVSGGLTYFSDHDEIYWNVLDESNNVPIDSMVTKVILPEGVSNDQITISCYTGGYGSTDSDCTIFTENNYVEVTSSRVLEAGEGLSVAVGFPKGYVAELMPTRDNSGIVEKILIGLFVIFEIFWMIYLPIKVFLKWRKDKKFTKENERVVAAWFSSPKTLGLRDLTPAETNLLIDKKVDHRAITATIIDLAQRGYLKIIQDKNSKKKFTFKKIKDVDSNMTSFEKELFDTIFLSKDLNVFLKGMFPDKVDTVTLKDLVKTNRFSSGVAEFKKKVAKQGFTEGFFEEDLEKVSTKYTILGSFAVLTLNVILGLVSFIFGTKSAKRSKLGVEKYSVAKSLKNFLVSQDTQLNFQAENQMFFEKLLPYATAFGVEKIWAKRFKELDIKPTDWYEGDMSNLAAWSAMSNTMSSSLRTATSTVSSSGFSSGSSGGGFSGGGGGGGSVGSW